MNDQLPVSPRVDERNTPPSLAEYMASGSIGSNARSQWSPCPEAGTRSFSTSGTRVKLVTPIWEMKSSGPARNTRSGSRGSTASTKNTHPSLGGVQEYRGPVQLLPSVVRNRSQAVVEPAALG